MLEIKNKIEIEENIWVGEVDSSAFNSSQEARIKAVTDIGSICYGRLGFNDECSKCFSGKADISYDECPICGRKHLDSKSISRKRLNLYNRLKVESNNNASTAFEFIPVKIEERSLYKFLNYDSIKMVNKVYKYSYLINEDGTEYLLTNMRTLLKAGIKEEDIPFNTPEELKGFKVIVCNQPKVSFDHIIRHRGLSVMCESSRNKRYLKDVKFHYPGNSVKQRVLKNKDNDTLDFLTTTSSIFKPEDATKELSCRRLILNAWSGWAYNPQPELVEKLINMSQLEREEFFKKNNIDLNPFDNLFAVRGKGTGTQEITGKIVDNIKTLIYGK